jgi:hypothetical protein
VVAARPRSAGSEVPISLGDEDFSGEALVRGVSATAQQCESVPASVWVRTASGDAECIRYWTAGLSPGKTNARMLVYLTGDQLAFDQPEAGYVNRSPKLIQTLVDGMASRAGVPVMLLSRPGTFGSSGDHKQRRRHLEPQLISAALDVVKARHGISELVLVGLSGGGHTVASLLGWRSDIVCAVPTSSVSSPRLRWEGMGRTTDLTGYADSYEPVDHLKRDVMHPKLRVFILGDPRDSNVRWSTQTPLAIRLKELGANVEVLTGEGSDSQRHALGESGRLIGAACLLDRPTAEILEIAARGLKG